MNQCRFGEKCNDYKIKVCPYNHPGQKEKPIMNCSKGINCRKEDF